MFSPAGCAKILFRVMATVSSLKPITFLKEVRAELTKVDWPTRQQTTRLTLIVIGISVATALILGGFDFIFTKLMEIVLKR